MIRLMAGRVVWTVLLPGIAVAVLQNPSPGFAQGATDYPIPSRASEAFSPIAEGFDGPIEPRADLRGPKRLVDPRETRLELRRAQRWPGAPTFFRETKLHANSRTYWFDKHDFGFDEPRALTTGGSLTYESGYLADFFQLRGALYTTQPLYANEAAGGTMNLSVDGDQITTLGQINARFRLAGQEITAGRQLVRTPYINPFDVRMIPLTFEGVVLLPQSKDTTIEYIASYLSRYKPRDRSDFISFSEGLGIDQDEGVFVAGAAYHAHGWNIGASNYWIKDALNTFYGEIDYLFPFGGDNDGPSLRAGVNILDQRTVGADLIAGAPYNTYQASARLIASYQGFVFTAAVSKVGQAASIQKPFGFSPSYTAMMVTNFRQAGVEAYLVSLSYDLAGIGLDGFKAEAAWGKGRGVNDPLTNADFANQEELDLRLVYEPHGGALEGLRAEVAYIDWHVFDQALPSQELTEFRTIVNYAIPLL